MPDNHNMGTITINFGDVNSRSVLPPWPPNELLEYIDYEITLFSDNESIPTFTASYGETISKVVTAGLWNIKIDAFLEDRETPVSPNGERIWYATGKNSYLVIGGINNTVPIEMFPICQECKEKYPCECDSNEDQFVPVTAIISNFNEIIQTDVPVLLNVTVLPINATNKIVTWTIIDDGGTNSSITNNRLTAEFGGTILLTALIVDGVFEGVDFNANFELTVVQPPVPNYEARRGSEMFETLADAIAAAGDAPSNAPAEIIILKDITTSGITLGNIEDRHIRLIVEDYNNYTITLDTGWDGPLFNIQSGSSLILGGEGLGNEGTLTLTGGNAPARLNRRGVNVSGTLEIINSVTITNFRNTGDGGGVFVNSGTFHMKGGTISNNEAEKGAGVFLSGGGTFFNMSDGYITENKANQGNNQVGGGVVVSGPAIFNFIGGFISLNTSDSDGGGIHISGGTIFMIGGNIIDNVAASIGSGSGGGINIIGGTVNISDGYISRNSAVNGGGINLSGARLNITGGTIGGDQSDDANIASNNGGGVSVVGGGTFDMRNGTISYNESSNGGGVSVMNGGSFYMKDGTISYNRSDASGGGVFNSAGTFWISNGEIINNISAIGRALYVENDGRAESGIFDGDSLSNTVILSSPYDDDIIIEDGDLRP